MTLGDAHEFIAVDSPAFRLVNQTFLVLVLSKSTVQNVKTSITLDPSIKAVSFHEPVWYRGSNCFSKCFLLGNALK
jgi:hypothetical protein